MIMQHTEKYYEADAFRKTAEGRILAAETTKAGPRIALDGTVFYPEGGGQPADTGTLTLPDGTVLHVLDVHESEGVLWHTVDTLPAGAAEGTVVAEAIDWEWALIGWQQHTGEHILPGILHQMFGAENVGFHIGTDAVRMDTSVPISAEGLRAGRAGRQPHRLAGCARPHHLPHPRRAGGPDLPQQKGDRRGRCAS